MRSSRSGLWIAAVVSCAAGCSQGSTQDTVHGAEAPAAVDDAREGTIFHLAGRRAEAGGLSVEVDYKVRRDAGVLSKTLALDIEHAPPGITHELTSDGFALGRLKTSSKGKAEFELSAAGDDYFPDGFAEPKEGTVVRVGALAEIRLQTVHKLTDLQLDIAGPGPLTGKAGYKVERLGEAVMTEFQVKLTHAEVKSVQPVKLDGVHVGDLTVDLAGKGRLLYSSLEGEPFPPGFQAPHSGSTVEVGELYKGQLRDNLAGQ